MIYYASLRPIEDALKEIVKNDGEKIEWFQSQLSDLTAKNEGLRKALIITRSHASDIRMTNIGFKPNGYDVVKTDSEKIEWFQSQHSTLQAENERLRELPLEILNNHLALVKKVSERVYGTKEK